MAATSKFSTKEALRFGWETFKKHAAFFILLFSGIAVMYMGLGALKDLADGRSALLSVSVSLVDWLLRISISIGLIEIPLMFLDGQKPDFGHLFSGYKHIWNYFVASILYMLIVVGGCLLLVIPGLIWAIRFQFYAYLTIDKGMKPVAALKKSWAMTQGSMWDLINFIIIISLINIAGALMFLVGLFITAPISLLAIAFVYRKLFSHQAIDDLKA